LCCHFIEEVNVQLNHRLVDLFWRQSGQSFPARALVGGSTGFSCSMKWYRWLTGVRFVVGYWFGPRGAGCGVVGTVGRLRLCRRLRKMFGLGLVER
jgi:hypothetical protein